MASLVRRGKKWYVAWRENGAQRRKALDTESKAEARKLLEVWHREAARDRLRAKSKNPTVETFQAAYDVWARNHLKQKTRDTQRQRWQDFIVWIADQHGVAGEDFAAKSKLVRMGDVSKQSIQQFKTHLLDAGMSKATVNNYIRDISAHFGHAMKTLELFSGPNPCQNVERLKLETSPPPYLSKEQIDVLLTAAQAHSLEMHWFCLLGIFEGLRLGEIVNAQWQWFDWTGKLLNVPSDETFSVKSHKARSIPLHDRVVEAMQPHAHDAGYLFDSGTPTGKVTSGAWVYRYSPRTAFNTVLKRAKLEGKGITPHVLRHTFGTQLARAGVSIYKIREWMGHSDVKVTARYAHVQGYDGDINKL